LRWAGILVMLNDYQYQCDELFISVISIHNSPPQRSPGSMLHDPSTLGLG
jgi:hypothetical protein